jgi:maltoporin
MRAAWLVAIATLLPSSAAGEEAGDGAGTGGGEVGVGSYGRVVAGTDLRGGTPERVAVVAHPPRIVEASYLELDLYYELPARRGISVRAVATPALGGELFHYSAGFDADVAVRNLFAEAVVHGDVGVWVGSRMYRGDDIYLLDWWPLDGYNTVGGGAWWRGGAWDVRGHVGVHRPRDPFYFQEVEVPAADFGAATIAQLDRQRFVASATPAWRAGDWQVKLHVDVQALDDGTRRREDQTLEALPGDFGWTAGAQVGAWGFGPGASHANLFAKLARGLAAFDELAAPTGLDADLEARGAEEVLVGASAAYEFPHGGALAGAYTRRFVDADANAADNDDGWEQVVDVRPYGHLFDGALQGAVDLSVQVRHPRGVSPVLGEGTTPTVWQVAPMLILSPQGEGAYARPHLRLVYRGARLNEGARDLYPLDDVRRGRAWVHFLGVQAEWWFHSSTYGAR